VEGIILTKVNWYAVGTLIAIGWLGQINSIAWATSQRIAEPSAPTTKKEHAQIPTLPPPQDINSPTEGVNINVPDPFAPPPPLGYPEESPQRVPDTQFNEYVLGIGDSIAVTVERFADLNFSGTIDLQGNVLVPLVGNINVLGLTPDQVEGKLAVAYSEFVVDPDVTVVLAGLRPATITIAGEVTRPGYYSLAPGSQLTAALQAAGGTTNLADLRTVIVRRRSPVDNSIIEQQIDLFTPLQNATALPDVRLRDGDSVVVLELETGTTTDYDRSLASRSTLATPQITLRVLSYPNGRIGNLNLPNGSNFIDALTSLAPSLDDADLGEIALMRFDPERGKVVTQEIDGKAVLMGDLAQNVPLQNEDVIVVGRSLIAKINYALRLVTRPFSDFLGFRNFFENVGDVFGSGDDN
jgi:polysaccharide export outer membrane protein